jgi:hypothetical protein
VSALLPPALLLLWSGLAATLLSGLVLAPLLGESTAGLGLAPTRARLPAALLLGLLVLPVFYALGFLLLRNANLITGALLGILHALVLAARSLVQGGGPLLRQNGRRLVLCIVYGALLGFAYTMP